MNLGVNCEDMFGEMMLPAELRLTDGALEGLPLLMDGLNMAFQVIVASEPLRTLLAGKRLCRRLVLFVPGQHVSTQVMLLRKFLTALDTVKRPDFLVDSGDVLLKVIFSREPVLADVTLPVSALLFLRLAVFAESYAAPCNDGLIGDGVAERDAGVLVLAVESRGVELVLLFGGAGRLMEGSDVSL
jgi:hypothetical protein